MIKPLFLALLVLVLLAPSWAFAPASICRPSSTTLYGLFDGLQRAFANEQFSSPPPGMQASARHILLQNREDCQKVIDALGSGMAFADAARQYSTCTSSSKGGSLGTFRPGTMVAEFEQVVFDPSTELGQVVGPVPTQFGYHLIVVDQRTGV